jgi:S1-C subfamily serine protease
VAEVAPLSPAQLGGLREADVILSVQGQAVRSVDEVTRALSALPEGRTARLVVWRFEDGQGEEILIQIRKR